MTSAKAASRTTKKSGVQLSAPRDFGRFRRLLLSWYDRNRRDLPWRNTRDPYAIWLSEIMLQQTRVAAVLEHYRLFLERFPDVSALAAASEDAVVAAWSGLGYYRRARMLHRCSQEIVAQHGGRFPATAAALQDLPGIGRYTSAAIASIAFGEPVAVVDGNVERVLRRIDGRVSISARTWERAQALLSQSRPGDFNQAMMELGATVCLPREARCEECPVLGLCVTQAREMRSQGSGFALLQAASSPRQTKRHIWCSLDRRDGHVRLVRRPKNVSLMAGMWELPQWTDASHESVSAEEWRTFRHSITVSDYTVHVLRDWQTREATNKEAAAETRASRGKWVSIKTIPQLPITGLTRKILKADGII